MKVAGDKLRGVLGLTEVSFSRGQHTLATLEDQSLADGVE